jgi:putative transcriptional regulator
VAEELGSRIRTARLNANLSQAELAKKTGLSIKAIVNTEKGKSQLETVITVLQGLNLAGQLDLLIPNQEISPLQLAKLKGRQRQRASRSRTKKHDEDITTW